MSLIPPDGSHIAAKDAEGRLVACTIAAPPCRPVPGARERDVVAGWTADGKSLFFYQGHIVPTQIDRLDVATGARTLWKTIHPTRAALTGVRSIVVTADGVGAYGYNRARPEVYVVKGRK